MRCAGPQELDPTLPKSAFRRFDVSWMRTPRSRFVLSTSLFVIFLLLQAVSATQVANVKPDFAEAGAIITIYVFAWGHFFVRVLFRDFSTTWRSLPCRRHPVSI